MTSAKREKTYALLARMHTRDMEAEAGVLVDLQDQAASLISERETLEAGRRAGAKVDMIEAMAYRAQFLETMRSEGERIDEALTDLQRQIDAQRETVMGKFQDKRASEALEDGAREQRLRALMMKQQTDLEEQMLIRRLRSQ